jgi:hypothetical protein
MRGFSMTGSRVVLRGAWCVAARALAAMVAMGALVAPADAAFTTFESGQVRPLALSPNGQKLFAVNTPDGQLEIFDVVGAVSFIRDRYRSASSRLRSRRAPIRRSGW